MLGSRIIGTGAYAPAGIITNEEIERTVPGASAAWTREHLGIRERHIVAADEDTGTLAAEAGRRAIRNAGLTPRDIGLVIVCTTTARRLAPSTACWVQHAIGAGECPAFDLGAVCSGFIYGLAVADQFVANGACRNALVIGADVFTRITDWTRRDCVFFGDGAGAVVVGPGEGMLAFDLGADGAHGDAWTVPPGERYWQMDGRAVYDMATYRIPWTLGRSLQAAGLTVRDIDHVIPHQPSLAILKRSAEIVGIPFERVHTNMDRYANTSAATIPLLLHEVHDAGLLKRGDVLALVAVGAGWTWGSAIMRWGL